MKKKLLLPIAGAMLLTLASCTIDISFPTTTDVVKTITSHDHVYEESVVDPTCEEEGYTLHKCSCGTRYKDNITEALGHARPEEVTVISEGDCMTKSVIQYTCTRCGKTVEEEDEYGGHHLVSNGDGTDPTCTEAGKTPSYTCSLCGFTKDSAEIPALGHSYEYNVSKDATCTEEGYASSAVCTRCGHVESGTVIPALGHDYSNVTHTTPYGSYMTKECSRGDSVVFTESFVTSYTTNYDYISLGENYENGEKYQAMYASIYSQALEIWNSDSDYEADSQGYIKAGSYNFKEQGLTIGEASSVLLSFIQNNPQFYFLSTGYLYSDKTIYLRLADEYAAASVRATINAEILSMEQDYYEEYSKKSTYTDQEKAKLIHDFICNRIDYAYSSPGVPETATWAHSMIGVAEKKGGVCEAYARTYLYLSKLSGLSSIIVAGIGNGGGHAWNYTKIGDSWYGVDVTWDDQSYGIITNYFLATESKMSENHTVGSSVMSVDTENYQVPLPSLATA